MAAFNDVGLQRVVFSKAPGAAPFSNVVFGTAGNDSTLAGDALADRLYGMGGDDVVTGLGGADHIEGGSGNDQLAGGDGVDTLLGGSGADTLDGGVGGDQLLGEAGVDTLRGDAGDDWLDEDRLSLSSSRWSSGNPSMASSPRPESAKGTHSVSS